MFFATKFSFKVDESARTMRSVKQNATNRTCQHPQSWIFQMLGCILGSEMSLLVAQTLKFKARKTLPFDNTV